MHFTSDFYRVAAVCSFVSAVTTLGLIFLPEMFPPAEDFAGRMARVNDPTYRIYSWVYLVHPFFTVAAALGVSMRLRRDAAALVIPGLLAFLLWGATEAGQQALTLMAFNPWPPPGSPGTRPSARPWSCGPSCTTASGTPCIS
jgi:lipopolysaccharide export LptBFGC system permease protein LptF